MASNFEKVINLARSDIGPPEFMRWHAQVAREALAEELASRSDHPDVVRIVDGVKNRIEDAVKLHGIIRYEFHRAGTVVPEVLNWLIAEGRKVSPKFSDHFFAAILKTQSKVVRGKRVTSVTGEGRPIPASRFGTMHIPEDAGFIVGNDRPFNRKVDVQLIGQERMHFTIEDQIYERCAIVFRRRYPEYNFRRVYTLFFSGQYRLQTGPRKGTYVQSPGLVIERV